MQIFERIGTGSVHQLTHFPARVVDFAWSPSGRQIAAGVADVPSSRPFLEAGDNDYTLGTDAPAEHLWLVSPNDGNAQRLTSGAWTLPQTDSGGIFSSQFAWSPDGRRIIFTRLPNTASGDNEYSTLWEIDIRGTHLRKLTDHHAFELSPEFSPSGAQWLYSYPRGGNYLAENTFRLVDAGRTTDITAGFDFDAGGALWLPDGKALLVCASDRTHVGSWILDLHGDFRPLRLSGLNIACDSYQDSEYDAGIAASASHNGAIALVASDTRSAKELYYLSSIDSAPRRLTHFNDFVRNLELGAQREISWRSPDGFTDYGVLTFPPHMVEGRRYPIVVNIHGGPGQASITDFSPAPGWPRAQLMASHGYIVFEPNYRGSDDAGNTFLLAIIGNTVRGPAADIMSGLRAVERLPQADPQRVGVCGWSYGGLLTSWLITQYHMWRAAVSGAAVNNEIEEYAFSESNVQDRYYQGISPYAPGGDRIYRNNSPITFAGAVTTPTLIWGTNGDPVVPVTQAYEFYHALHEHHVPVRFVVFPANTHGPDNEQQTETLTRLWLDWLDRYLK